MFMLKQQWESDGGVVCCCERTHLITFLKGTKLVGLWELIVGCSFYGLSQTTGTNQLLSVPIEYDAKSTTETDLNLFSFFLHPKLHPYEHSLTKDSQPVLILKACWDCYSMDCNSLSHSRSPDCKVCSNLASIPFSVCIPVVKFTLFLFMLQSLPTPLC